MTTVETIIGIDVSKANLDCWALPAGQGWRVEYTDAALTRLGVGTEPDATGPASLWRLPEDWKGCWWRS